MKKHSKPSFKFAKKDKFYKPKDKEKDSQKEKEKEEKKKEEKETKKLKFKKKKHEGSKTDVSDTTKVKEVKPAFSVPLHTAVERSRCHDGVQLPAVFRECIDYVEEFGLSCEGIYRISGVKSKVQALKDAYNRGLPVYLHEHEPPIVASLLKQFLRDLPEPVLTGELMPKFEQASTIKNVKQKVEMFQQLIEQLPTPNRLLLSWMIVHMTHVIAKESHNKMSLQNVSIVLSPTMRISHRVLNVFFTYSKILFRDTVIKRYVPPLRPVSSRWSLELPESPTAIEEELHKQESLLNQLHEDVRKVKNAAEKEEQLWEVQRVVTQLKRKLKHVRKAQEAAKAAEKREAELAQEKLKEQEAEKQKKAEEEAVAKQQAEAEAEVEATPEVETVETEVAVEETIEPTAEVEEPPVAQPSTDEGDGAVPQTVAPDETATDETAVQQQAPQQPIPPQPAPPQQPPTVIQEQAQVHQPQEGAEEHPAVSAVVHEEQTVTETPEIVYPPQAPQGVLPQPQLPPQPQPEQHTPPDVVTQQPLPQQQQHQQQPEQSVTTALPPPQQTSTHLSPMPPTIPKLQSPLQPQKLHSGQPAQKEDGAEKPETIVEEGVTFEVGGEAFRHDQPGATNDVSEEHKVTQGVGKISLEDRPEKVQITTIEIVDRKGLPTVETTEEAVIADKSDAESSTSSVSVVSSPDEETDNEETQELLLEERTLTLEEEELRAIGDELLQKIETEKSEIERLHQEIAELQEIRDDLYEEEDSDSDSDSSSEDEDELQETMKTLIQENKELEVQNSDLCNKVHLERQICLEVKVQIRLIQLSQKQEAERELMIF